MILCDIGNSFYHFWIDGEILHCPINEPLTPFEGEIYYITVNKSAEEKLLSTLKGINIAPFAFLEGAYSSMGIDRIVGCVGVGDGVIVDAGSAITIDIMDKGVFKGGYILAGLGSLQNTMKSISPKLDSVPSFENISSYPKTTSSAIGCGYKMAVVAMIEKIVAQEQKPLFFTGGDGKKLNDEVSNGFYNKSLIFQGMKKILEQKGIQC